MKFRLPDLFLIWQVIWVRYCHCWRQDLRCWLAPKNLAVWSTFFFSFWPSFHAFLCLSRSDPTWTWTCVSLQKNINYIQKIRHKREVNEKLFFCHWKKANFYQLVSRPRLHVFPMSRLWSTEATHLSRFSFANRSP